MKKIADSFDELIGKTPMLRLHNIEKAEGLHAQLFAKLEAFNPGCSIKDRVACSMLDDAEKSGMLKPGGTIIEPTSGNTGIGIAAIASVRGYKCIITMPDSASIERRKVLAALGAELILTDGALATPGAIAKANEILAEHPDYFMPAQFRNPANPKAHYEGTAPEIFDQLDGKVDIFIAGAGTGGTVSGCGRYFKDNVPACKVVVLEPAGSPMISEGKKGPHKLQGIGPGYIPDNLDRSVIDEVMTVTDEYAYKYGRMLAKKEGLLMGITSGAALSAAVKLAKLPENEGKNIVAIFPDTGNRYLSGDYFEE